MSYLQCQTNNLDIYEDLRYKVQTLSCANGETLDQDELEILLEARAQLTKDQNLDGEDELICECECVSLKDIRGFSRGKSISLQELRDHFNLGAGCSSCLKSYSTWKAKI